MVERPPPTSPIQRTDCVRVLVVLDPSSPRSEALEAIACLTDGGSARLTGLYIEDADLFNLAQLPFAREVRRGGGPSVALDPKSLSLQVETQAGHMRRLFESTSSLLRLPSSFHVVRGNVLEELERAAKDADLLLIGRAGRSSGAHSWKNDVMARLPATTRKTVVFVQEKWRTGKTVVVYFDGSEESPPVLDLAIRMANLEGAPLLVLVASGDHQETLRDAARQQLQVLGAKARIEPAWPLDSIEHVESWRRLLHHEDARVLVVPDGKSELYHQLLGHLDCSLVVVSKRPADGNGE